MGVLMEEQREMLHGLPLTKIKTLLDFIRTNDSQKIYLSWSNNKLRDYVYTKRNLNVFFYGYIKDVLCGIIEFYRAPSLDYLSVKLKNKQQLTPIRQGKIIWAANLFFVKRLNNRGKRLILKNFIKFLKDFDNVYWWKLKNNKILLCKFRRK